MTRKAPNNCPACSRRNKSAEWATDGSGTHPFILVDGKPVHEECLRALSRFVASVFEED